MGQTRTQQVVVEGRQLDVERSRRGLRIIDVASMAGTSYKTAWRCLNLVPVGEDLAARVARALGFRLADVLADPDERRPASGFSPAAVQRFNKHLKHHLDKAVSACHSEIAGEADRRCWFWPSLSTVLKHLNPREITLQVDDGGARHV